MSDKLITGVVSILLAIVGVAILATLFSPRASTSRVIGSAGNAFSQALLAAVSPVTGNTPSISPSMG